MECKLLVPLFVVSVVFLGNTFSFRFENVGKWPMETRILLKPFFADGYSSNSTNATCHFESILPCLLNFFTRFGFNGLPSSSYEFESILGKYEYDNGISGLNNVKGWLETLQNCSGPSQFDSCLHWQNIMSSANISQDDAKQWEVIFRNLLYEMGPAYQTFVGQWYCLVNTELHASPAITKCYTTLMDNITNNPNGTCGYMNDYTKCISNVYEKTCGQDAASFIYNLTSIDFKIYLPKCF